MGTIGALQSYAGPRFYDAKGPPPFDPRQKFFRAFLGMLSQQPDGGVLYHF